MDNIKVAFCFDENLITQVQVAVASLLDAVQNENVHYDIYCICTKEASSVKECLEHIIQARDQKSILHLHSVENPYGNAYEVRGISAGTYLRLMLHRLLSEVDKVLYMDVDVLVCGSLLPIWQKKLGDHILAAVKGAVNLVDKWEWNSDRSYWKLLEGQRGNYINAGVTLMNLQEIRRLQLERQWNELAKEKLYYQDQDILNITCRNKILYLPPKYNRLAYMDSNDYNRFVEEGIYSVREYEEALHNPIIIHYAGDKPWKRYDTNLGSLWWDYVNSQPDLKGLFDEAAARRYHGLTLWERCMRKMKKMLGREKL
ncbi:MAG: glycosyltransferase family 8 protein [Lachnospiraceae bacterium]|nr:glycosyltransferase family 8 protein [Lachnospiraceae bacterium]